MKAIFLDRDETLNHDPGYLNNPDQLELKEYVIEGLQLLKLAGFEFIVITNQSGIARDLITQEQLDAVHNRLQGILSKHDLQILKIYSCPDKDNDSKCRKPNPGMIKAALAEFDIDLKLSYIIGDRLTDIETGQPFNLTGILLKQPDRLEKIKKPPPKNLVYQAENLLEAAHYIFKREYEKNWKHKIYDKCEENFLKKIEDFKKDRKIIVFTNGCFDLLHSGHLQYLFQASLLGDVLAVGLNSDQSVESIKGSPRPILGVRERATLLANLDFIDMVITFNEDTPLDLIKKIKPNIHVKGGDYLKEKLAEYPFLRGLKAKVVILPFKEGFSSSNIITKITKISSLKYEKIR